MLKLHSYSHLYVMEFKCKHFIPWCWSICGGVLMWPCSVGHVNNSCQIPVGSTLGSVIMFVFWSSGNPDNLVILLQRSDICIIEDWGGCKIDNKIYSDIYTIFNIYHHSKYAVERVVFVAVTDITCLCVWYIIVKKLLEEVSVLLCGVEPSYKNVFFSPKYCKISNIRHTKSQHLNDCCLVLHLSLPSPLKLGVKSRMKM